jgi:ABC-type hemin transport system substrate-binding protein
VSSSRPSEVADDTGRAVPVRAGGSIVSLVPSITELVCDLGAGARLVGVTRYCTEPAARVAAIEQLGGTKNPDCDRIAALRPALVFVERDENRREDFERLQAAGLAVFVAHPRTVRGVASLVRRIGACLGRGAAADELAARIEAEVAAPPAAPRRRVFCPIWRNPWMTFNQTTYAADLIRQAGGDNVCNAAETYPQITLAEIAALAPEVVLLPDEPYVFAKRHLTALGELADTPAMRAGRVHLVDGKAMFWYGARTPAALRMLRGFFSGTGNCEPGTGN